MRQSSFWNIFDVSGSKAPLIPPLATSDAVFSYSGVKNQNFLKKQTQNNERFLNKTKWFRTWKLTLQYKCFSHSVTFAVIKRHVGNEITVCGRCFCETSLLALYSCKMLHLSLLSFGFRTYSMADLNLIAKRIGVVLHFG